MRRAKKQVVAAQRQLTKQQLHNANKKFTPGPNPIEQEASLGVIQPTTRAQRDILLRILERMQTGANESQKAAIDVWKANFLLSDWQTVANTDFLKRFWCWLLGRGTEEDTARTLWGRENVAAHNDEVADYIELFIQKRLAWAMQLVAMANRVPTTLKGYYLYFKYIVNGRMRTVERDGKSYYDFTDEDFLDDWDIMFSEFEDDHSIGKQLHDSPANFTSHVPEKLTQCFGDLQRSIDQLAQQMQGRLKLEAMAAPPQQRPKREPPAPAVKAEDPSPKTPPAAPQARTAKVPAHEQEGFKFEAPPIVANDVPISADSAGTAAQPTPVHDNTDAMRGLTDEIQRLREQNEELMARNAVRPMDTGDDIVPPERQAVADSGPVGKRDQPPRPPPAAPVMMDTSDDIVPPVMKEIPEPQPTETMREAEKRGLRAAKVAADASGEPMEGPRGKRVYPKEKEEEDASPRKSAVKRKDKVTTRKGYGKMRKAVPGVEDEELPPLFTNETDEEKKAAARKANAWKRISKKPKKKRIGEGEEYDDDEGEAQVEAPQRRKPRRKVRFAEPMVPVPPKPKVTRIREGDGFLQEPDIVETDRPPSGPAPYPTEDDIFRQKPKDLRMTLRKNEEHKPTHLAAVAHEKAHPVGQVAADARARSEKPKVFDFAEKPKNKTPSANAWRSDDFKKVGNHLLHLKNLDRVMGSIHHANMRDVDEHGWRRSASVRNHLDNLDRHIDALAGADMVGHINDDQRRRLHEDIKASFSRTKKHLMKLAHDARVSGNDETHRDAVDLVKATKAHMSRIQKRVRTHFPYANDVKTAPVESAVVDRRSAKKAATAKARAAKLAAKRRAHDEAIRAHLPEAPRVIRGHKDMSQAVVSANRKLLLAHTDPKRKILALPAPASHPHSPMNDVRGLLEAADAHAESTAAHERRHPSHRAAKQNRDARKVKTLVTTLAEDLKRERGGTPKHIVKAATRTIPEARAEASRLAEKAAKKSASKRLKPKKVRKIAEDHKDFGGSTKEKAKAKAKVIKEVKKTAKAHQRERVEPSHAGYTTAASAELARIEKKASKKKAKKALTTPGRGRSQHA